MKKSIFVLSFFVFVAQFGLAQIKVTSYGNVGIGTLTPSTANNVTIEGDNIFLRSNYNNNNGLQLKYDWENEAFDLSPTSNGSNTIGYIKNFEEIYGFTIYGHVGEFTDLSCTSHFYNWSDVRLKKNINTLSFDKKLFSKLNPVSFDINDSLLLKENEKKAGKKPTTTSQYGFIAQEIQELYPQLVTKDEKTGFLKYKPLELIPILVAALHDQQVQIDQLRSDMKSFSLSKVKSSRDIPVGETQVATLFQNNPNPFSQSTQIKYYLPNAVAVAYLCIYNLQGKQLKQITISERGSGAQLISASEFTAGIYLYGLIADGNEVDVKRMILTE